MSQYNRERQIRTLYPNEIASMKAKQDEETGEHDFWDATGSIILGKPLEYQLRDPKSELEFQLNSWGINKDTPGLENKANAEIVTTLLQELRSFPQMSKDEKAAFNDVLKEFEEIPNSGHLAQIIKSKSRRISENIDQKTISAGTLEDKELITEIAKNHSELDQAESVLKAFNSKSSKMLSRSLPTPVRMIKGATKRAMVVQINRLRSYNRRLYEEFNYRPHIELGDLEGKAQGLLNR